MHRILGWLNPFDRTQGLRKRHYALAAALGAAIKLALVAIGIFTVTTLGASWFRQHYHVGLPVPAKHQKIPLPSGHAPPAAAHLNRRFLPSPGNQGTTNGCGAWSFAKMASYQTNRNHRNTFVFWSPRWFYDRVAKGKNVATAVGDYNAALRLYGAVPNKDFPYPANPTAKNVENPPATLARYARPVTLARHWLWRYIGAGWGAVVQAQRAIDTGHLPSIAFAIDASFYQAATTGWYDPAINGKGQLANRTLFGHDMVCPRYDNQHRFPNGDVGALLCENQWGGDFGVGWNGQRQSNGHNGFVWIAYRTVETVSFAADDEFYHGGSTGHGAGPHTGWTPVPAPKLRQHAPLPSAGNGTVYVHDVTTRDTGVDISNPVNQACAYYRLGWDCSVGLVALFGVESGIRQYAPHSPIGTWDVCDWSGGLSQINVCTAASYGVGNGSPYEPNVSNVLNYEQVDPVRDVWLTAKALADFKAHVCWDWYELYSSWNMGDGYGCNAVIYEYPNNPITVQAVASFKQWYSDVWSEYGTFTSPSPVPTPKPKRHQRKRLTASQASMWNRYRLSHKLRVISPRYHGHLSWAASVWLRHPKNLGGTVKHERWFPPNKHRKHGFEKDSFEGGSIYLHPYDHKSNIAYHRWKR